MVKDLPDVLSIQAGKICGNDQNAIGFIGPSDFNRSVKGCVLVRIPIFLDRAGSQVAG